MAYIGQSLTEGTRRAYTFVATAGQTTFNAVYGVGAVDVYQNGILLQPSDYNSSSGSSVVLGVGAAVNDEITIIAHNIFSVADTVSSSQGGTFAGNVQFDGSFTSKGIDDNADATAITIDSSENVKLETGNLQIKTIGQIEDNGTRLLCRSTGDASGLRFDGASYTPFKNGSAADGTVDLGFASGRFRDVFISGGLMVGGTTSANALDDYEEGTFNVAFSGATVSVGSDVANYTKIGNMVYWRYYTGVSTISSSSSSLILGGLPFNVANVHGNYSGVNVGINTFFGSSVTDGQKAYHQINHDYIYFVNPATISSPSAVNGSSKYLMVGGFYQTA